MKKLFMTCCLTAFCACNAMAQEFNDSMFDDSMIEDSTMVDSMTVEEFPLDNPVTQAIMARRSIRKYLNKPVEHEKLAFLAECGINAPSGSNRQPWVLRVVENQELLAQVNNVFKTINAKQIARDKGFKNMFRNAPNIILICTPANGGGEIDAGMLGQNIMLAAQSIGLGTCCLGGVVRFIQTNPKIEFFREALGIPIDYKINYIIAVGYPDETPEAKPRDLSKVIFID